jgi:hypothetical protein
MSSGQGSFYLLFFIIILRREAVITSYLELNRINQSISIKINIQGPSCAGLNIQNSPEILESPTTPFK